jgi:hypothetical protein
MIAIQTLRLPKLNKIRYLLIFFSFCYFNLASQDAVYDSIIYNILNDKEVRKELRGIFGRDSKKYISKNKFKFVVDTGYKCCSKSLVQDWFNLFIKENSSHINIPADSLANAYGQNQKESNSNPKLMNYSTDINSKVRIHFSQEIGNTIICQIFYYENYTAYENDAYFNTSKKYCMSIMYILDTSLKKINSRKVLITKTWRNLPIRVLD